jgi:hypothetical protein
MTSNEISMTYNENRDGMFWQPLWDPAFIVLAVMPIDSMEKRSFSNNRIDWRVIEQDKEGSPSVEHIAWILAPKLYSRNDGNTREKT